MNASQNSIGAAVAGIAFVQLGNGFLTTHVAMSSSTSDWSAALSGFVMASFSGGFTIGAATLGPLLQRVGHIRLFSALAGLAAACIILMPVFPSAQSWILLRALTGFSCAGLFLTAESWLNATSTPRNRGSNFAFYMVASSAALGVSQFVINLPTPGGYEFFSLSAALFGLALIPVALTRSAAPNLLPSPRLRIRELRRLAPVSFAGCATVGIISSMFFTLVPSFARAEGVEPFLIGLLISTAIFGGLCFQVPVERLSDRFDRRIVAGGLALGLGITALVIAFVHLSVPLFALCTFLLGGFMATIYPVCVSHASDRVEPHLVVATSGQLILIHGIASFSGPILGYVGHGARWDSGGIRIHGGSGGRLHHLGRLAVFPCLSTREKGAVVRVPLGERELPCLAHCGFGR